VSLVSFFLSLGKIEKVIEMYQRGKLTLETHKLSIQEVRGRSAPGLFEELVTNHPSKNAIYPSPASELEASFKIRQIAS
jgi:hypothetical protein